jgi:hypothetical protein
MGYIPIFLYLGSFIFLFILVVANNIKNKRILYQNSLDLLVLNLKEVSGPSMAVKLGLENLNLIQLEGIYHSLKAKGDKELIKHLDQNVKPSLAQARLNRYWYNKLIKQKPYYYVARLIGYSPIPI